MRDNRYGVCTDHGTDAHTGYGTAEISPAEISLADLPVEHLAGAPVLSKTPLRIFEDSVCEFLFALSEALRTDPACRKYPDVQSFAFYCRRSNIMRLKEQYTGTCADPDRQTRIGRGLAFHIAPSNIPVNFAFTYVFGLLAGNANIVRVSQKRHRQAELICEAMQRLLQTDLFSKVRKRTAILRFGHDQTLTDYFSQQSDVRVIWGGDQTICQIRKSPLPVRCVELAFADRYSFGIIDADAVLKADKAELARLAGQFYNDTYLNDQNACSTPHMICWLGSAGRQRELAKKKFWDAVYACAQKYDLADIKVCDKYVLLCKYAVMLSCMQADMKTEMKAGMEPDPEADIKTERYDNLLYLISLPKIPKNMTQLRGKFGLFFQTDLTDIRDLTPYINGNVQSCMYYGLDREQILQWVTDCGLRGIDRIVEFGSSLAIGVIWDGYDLIREMSRCIG